MHRPGIEASSETGCDRPWSGTHNYRIVSRSFPYLHHSVCGIWVWQLQSSDTQSISCVTAVGAIRLSSFTAEETRGWQPHLGHTGFTQHCAGGRAQLLTYSEAPFPAEVWFPLLQFQLIHFYY